MDLETNVAAKIFESYNVFDFNILLCEYKWRSNPSASHVAY